MSFAALLDHRVWIERRAESGLEDDYAQPVEAIEVSETFAAALQPKSVRDVIAISGAGASIGIWTVYLLPREVTTADTIVHDPAVCPKADTADLPALRFEITGVSPQTGRGHHLALDVRAVGVPSGIAAS